MANPRNEAGMRQVSGMKNHPEPLFSRIAGQMKAPVLHRAGGTQGKI